MSSREEILANIRKNTQKRFDYPEWEIKATTYPDIIEKFCEVSRVVGGEAVLLGKGEDINAVIRRTYPDAGRIASNLDEITCATFTVSFSKKFCISCFSVSLVSKSTCMSMIFTLVPT